MARYCTEVDLYRYGLPRGSVPNPGRLIDSVSASADTLSLDVHGLETDREVTLRPDAGGTMPAPLVAGTTYYAIRVSESVFKLAATAGGAAIDITSAGSNVLLGVDLDFASACDWSSRLLDDMMPGHVVPLTEPYPEIVVMTSAQLAIHVITSGRGRSDTLDALIDMAQKRIERWARGVPIRGANAPTAAGMATSARATRTDRRGWTRYGGTT